MRAAGSVRVATSDVFDLAEGPVWDQRRETLSWVDITAGAVIHGRLTSDGLIQILARWQFDQPVGAAVPGARDEAAICVGGRIMRRDADGSLSTLSEVVDDGTGSARRINDAKPDPLGRLVAGTLCGDQQDETELLVRLEHDGTITTIDSDLRLSNGLAWSADGSVMYSVDTLRHVIFRRSYADLGRREVHLELADGFPDGICLDSADHLWVAMWGAGEVRRYSPDGEMVGAVRLPAPHTSSVAFAGRNLDTLVITTARTSLSEDQLAAWPDSGRLFTVKPGVRGLPPTPWAGIRPLAQPEGSS